MASRILCELEELTAYLRDHLSGKADLLGAKILTEETADLTNEIARELATLGLSIVLSIPEAMPRANMSARTAVDAEIVLTISEYVIINRPKTGKSALYIASRALALLNLHKPPFAWCGPLLPKAPGMDKINLVMDPTKPVADQPSVVGWSLFFTAQVAIQPRATT